MTPIPSTKFKEVSADKILGKTIKGIAFSQWISQAVVCFDDDTFVTLDVDERWREPKIIFGTLALDSFGDDKLAQVGIIDSDKMATYREQLRKEEAERSRAREYAKYQKLKARFETDL